MRLHLFAHTLEQKSKAAGGGGGGGERIFSFIARLLSF
jgi:hypothetical protein